MRKFLHHVVVILTLSIAVLVEGAAASVASAIVAIDSSRVVEQVSASVKQENRQSFFSSLRNFFPFRSNGSADADKLLSSVKVFPNPVVDQISLSYRLGKKATVTIKVMDALGNEVMTLLQQELDAGPQSQVFETSNKLTNGFYFIRVSAGTETVIKRISVL